MSDLRTSLIKLAHENPELRDGILPLLKRSAEEEQEDQAKAGPSKKPGAKFIQFMKEVGDEHVRNPDTGNNVKLKSLKGERGRKIQHHEFEKWLKHQKSDSKSEFKPKGKPPEEKKDDKADKPKAEKSDDKPKYTAESVKKKLDEIPKDITSMSGNRGVKFIDDIAGKVTGDLSTYMAEAAHHIDDGATVGQVVKQTAKYFMEEQDDKEEAAKQLQLMLHRYFRKAPKEEGGLWNTQPTRRRASLRSQLIRLAHENPELRADLLPLLKVAGDPTLLDHLNKATETWLGLVCTSFSKQVYSKHGISWDGGPQVKVSGDGAVGIVHGQSRIGGEDHSYQAQISINTRGYPQMSMEWEFDVYGDPDAGAKESVGPFKVGNMTPQKAAKLLEKWI